MSVDPSLVTLATKNIRDVMTLALMHTDEHRALVIYDLASPLARCLYDAYRQVLPTATFLLFDEHLAQDILAQVDALRPGDLVVLIQSTNFRLNEFRLRIVLFQRSLKAVEHLHLNRMSPDQEFTYVESLAYNPDYYRSYGPFLKQALDAAQRVEVHCPGTTLIYDTAMEPAKLNIGDYRGMKNVGGTFPIGEVFTEPTDFSAVNGEVMIFAFADFDHLVHRHDPFRAVIREGIMESSEGPPEFQATLEMIRHEERVMVRELGLGLNRAMGKDHLVNDITAFERMYGVHLSLGEKHGVYKKPGLQPGKTRYHVDVFIDVTQIIIDDHCVFNGGVYLI